MWGVEHVAPISLTGGSEVAGRGALYCLLLPHFLLVSCATVVNIIKGHYTTHLAQLAVGRVCGVLR